MNFMIKTIPHLAQRYETLDDYVECNGVVILKISETGNPDVNFALAIHGLVEAYLCKKRGISFDEVDKFDLEHLDLEQPGEHPDAPYKREHEQAVMMERLMVHILDMKWKEYEDALAGV